MVLMLGPLMIGEYSLCGDPGDRLSYQMAVQRGPVPRHESTSIHETVRAGIKVVGYGTRDKLELPLTAMYRSVGGGTASMPLAPRIDGVDAARDVRLLAYGGPHSCMDFLHALAFHSARTQILPQARYGQPNRPAMLPRLPDRTLVFCCGSSLLPASHAEGAQRLTPGTVHLGGLAAKPPDPALLQCRLKLTGSLHSRPFVCRTARRSSACPTTPTSSQCLYARRATAPRAKSGPRPPPGPSRLLRRSRRVGARRHDDDPRLLCVAPYECNLRFDRPTTRGAAAR
jgi:hypothetical protein